MCPPPHFVMPGHSRLKDGVAFALLHPGIYDLLAHVSKDVDGRVKPGHDGEMRTSKTRF